MPLLTMTDAEFVERLSDPTCDLEFLVLGEAAARLQLQIDEEFRQWEHEVLYGKPGGLVPMGVVNS